jgi:branched-chain amino acid transport system substrate-binding protein
MKVRFVAGLLAAALVAVACGGDNKGSGSATTSASGGASTSASGGPSSSASGGGSLDSAHPYIYLISADFTGALQAATTAEVLGLKAAITDINAKGGINGREVRLETQNDQNDPTTAVNLLQQRLSSGKRPDAVYPGGSSAVTQAMLPILTREKILSTDATSSDALNKPSDFPYHFGVSQLASAPLPAFIAELQGKGYKKIGMIFANSATGQNTEASFSKGIKAAGMDFTSVSYDEKALDMTPQLQQLQATNPDAVIYSAFGTPTLYVLKSRNQMGWDIPFYADQIAAAFAYAKNMQPSELKNVFIQTSAAYLKGGVASNWPLLTHFTELVKAEEGGPASLSATGVGLAAVGYNALMMVKVGADQAGSDDAEAIAKALESMKPVTPFPFLSFGPNGEFGGYQYTSTNHFPTLKTEAFEYVTPGSYDGDGLYTPGPAA